MNVLIGFMIIRDIIILGLHIFELSIKAFLKVIGYVVTAVRRRREAERAALENANRS